MGDANATILGTFDPTNGSLIPGKFLAGNGVFTDAAAFDSAKDELFVASTEGVSVISVTNDTVVAALTAGSNPTGVAYDPQDGEVFVANQGSNDVSVIADSNNRVVATIVVGASPEAVVYDTGTRQVFVAEAGVNNGYNTVQAAVIATSNNTVVASIPGGYGSQGIAYDPAQNEVFISNQDTSSVSVIADSNDSVLRTFGVGGQPIDMVYDPRTDEVFVADLAGQEVTVINASTNATSSIGIPYTPYGNTPWGVAYDPNTREVFVSDSDANNVTVISDTNDSVVATLGVVEGPAGLVDVPTLSEVFVTSGSTGQMSVISASSNSVVATFDAGSSPFGIAYDSGQQEMFVTNYYGSRVDVISTDPVKLVATIDVGPWAYGVAYDAAENEVFVTNEFPGRVDVIADANNTVVATINLGEVQSTGVVAIPSLHKVFVANYYAYDLSVISDTSNTVIGTVDLPSHCMPEHLTYDSAKEEVFVSNWGGGVSVVNATTDELVTTISVDDGDNLAGIAYDPNTGEILVDDNNGYVWGYLAVISDSTNAVTGTVRVDGQPWGVAYDPRLDEYFESGDVWNNVLVIRDTDNAVVGNLTPGDDPSDIAVDTANGLVFVANTLQGTVSILSSRGYYPIMFNESGLPAGTSWSVTVNGSANETSGQSVRFVLLNGNYSFSVNSSDSRYGASGGKFTVNGSGLWITVNFTEATYPVSVTESGLPAGSAWWFNITGGASFRSNTTTTGFPEPNGTYDFSVGTANKSWAASSGSFVVNGTGTPVGVKFSLVTFRVTFTELGLPTDTLWWVNLTGGASHEGIGTSLQFAETNGSYPFAVATSDKEYAAPGGVFVVRAGANVSLIFVPVVFSVTFEEKNLPLPVKWWVNFTGGPSQSSTNGSITVQLMNGSYPYTFASSDKEYRGAVGAVLVAGVPEETTLAFSLIEYVITFVQSGLPIGEPWNVTLAGVEQQSAGPSMQFPDPNGSYPFSVDTVSGYLPTPPSGTVTLGGHNVTEEVVFSPKPSTGPPATSLSTALEWELAAVATVVTAAAVGGVLFARRRRRSHR